MTGILGTKAYRCLNSSRVVLLILAILRLAILALMGLDLAQYQGRRRLSGQTELMLKFHFVSCSYLIELFTGSCVSVERSKVVPVTIVLQAVESLFICGCCKLMTADLSVTLRLLTS